MANKINNRVDRLNAIRMNNELEYILYQTLNNKKENKKTVKVNHLSLRMCSAFTIPFSNFFFFTSSNKCCFVHEMVQCLCSQHSISGDCVDACRQRIDNLMGAILFCKKKRFINTYQSHRHTRAPFICMQLECHDLRPK